MLTDGNERINTATQNGISYDERLKLCQANVTLDGRPARVMGAKFKFAAVVFDGDSMTGYQWSWSAVKRIIANGGKFKS